MNEKIVAVKSLELSDVKIYEARPNKASFFTKGKLEVMYVSDLDRFILRLNNFKYILSPLLPILASASKEESARSYVLPNMSGNYIIRLRMDSNPVLIKNLETIFTDYSEFRYDPDYESYRSLEKIQGPEEILNLNEGQEIQQSENVIDEKSEEVQSKLDEQASAIIEQALGPLKLEHSEEDPAKMTKEGKSGSTSLKQRFAKAALFIGKRFKSNSKGKPIERTLSESRERSLEELKGFGENAETIEVELPRYEVNLSDHKIS